MKTKVRPVGLRAPMDRSYWVIPGQLLAGAYPGALDPEEREYKLKGLLSSGIQLVINLMEANEKDRSGRLFSPYKEKLTQFAMEKKHTIFVEHYPIQDLGIPEKSFLARILDRIDLSLAENKPVYVHCWGGHGRTGTVIGCHLIRHGLSNRDSVLSEIEELRFQGRQMYGNSPETRAQIQMVQEWNEPC